MSTPFILSTFVDDLLVAIKSEKWDQFYEQLNGVYPEVINFMMEVEQGDRRACLRCIDEREDNGSSARKWLQITLLSGHYLYFKPAALWAWWKDGVLLHTAI